ncbi:MAG: hypothetical protein DSY66_04370 [Persephonella sp.]|nr:MAG: hypothetical protein DSY66_04370 [Persephonella sp.]
MFIKWIFILIWILIIVFLIWFFFLRNRKKSEENIDLKSEKIDIKEKIFSILIEIYKLNNLSSNERNKIYDKLEEIINLLEKLDEIDIPQISKYEINKLIGDYLYRLILSLKTSKSQDIDKLLEGIDIIKTQLEKIYNNYIDNSLDLESEIEFLKRKFKSI